MHIRPCAPNTQGIQLYAVYLALAFNNLVRRYAPSLYPVVHGIAVNSEELGGLSDRHVPLLRLDRLCALCAVLSHVTSIALPRPLVKDRTAYLSLRSSVSI